MSARPAIALLAVLLSAACAPRSVPPRAWTPLASSAHVVIVTVDGLRPDAIAGAPMPNLARLAAGGASTLDARAASPTVTLPNHLSMATGLAPATHGVRSNHELRGVAFPTIFSAVHGGGGRTGLYYGKAKLAALAPDGSADVRYGPAPGAPDWAGAAAMRPATRFAADFPRERYALAWIHLSEPDLAGHGHGWMSPEYLAAARAADGAVGAIAQAIADSGLAAATLLIVTADHGGEGGSHRAGTETDARIPWLCEGGGVAPATLPPGERPMDVAPTALAALGLPPLPRNEGRVIGACLGRAP